MVGVNNARPVGLAHWLKSFSQWVGWLLVIAGGLVLIGWALAVEPLKRVFPGFVAMNPVTAVGFIIGGASLFCFWLKEKFPMPAFMGGQVLAGLLVALGIVKLCEYELGWHWSFDQVFFQNQIQHEAELYNHASLPNQIAPNTAFNFLIGGFALWALNSHRRRFSGLAQNLSLILLFISLVPLAGYAYRSS